MARELGFADMQTLAQVGAAREAQAQAELQDDIQRFNYEQMLPQQKLADFITAVGGGTVGGQQQQPVFRNPAAGFLSGGLAGAQAAQMMGNPAYGIRQAAHFSEGLCLDRLPTLRRLDREPGGRFLSLLDGEPVGVLSARGNLAGVCHSRFYAAHLRSEFLRQPQRPVDAIRASGYGSVYGRP